MTTSITALRQNLELKLQRQLKAVHQTEAQLEELQRLDVLAQDSARKNK